MPNGAVLPDHAVDAIHAFADKYLAGASFAIEYVSEIPLLSGGNRRVVIVER